MHIPYSVNANTPFCDPVDCIYNGLPYYLASDSSRKIPDVLCKVVRYIAGFIWFLPSLLSIQPSPAAALAPVQWQEGNSPKTQENQKTRTWMVRPLCLLSVVVIWVCTSLSSEE